IIGRGGGRRGRGVPDPTAGGVGEGGHGMDGTLAIAAAIAIGYALGTIPTGMIVGRAHGVDLTATGSRRTGATNVLRTLGPRWAAVVALGDVLKGALAALAAGALTAWNPWGQVLAAMAAIVGHTYSPFIGFRSGRGVLTGAGGVLIIAPVAFVVGLVVGSLAIWATRYVSLGSLVAALAAGLVTVAPVLLWAASPAYLVYGLAVPAFIVLAHRDNIHRLLSGTERKLGERA
ncbi:MAG: glycerol-3-phosphate 1-O-acyltransferase PlsY, partial [Chloroflexota bacterium]|nr:glycerol-3-phosphate 1-O-acyltransferase PlsY [Chloroflexota bacterium]